MPAHCYFWPAANRNLPRRLIAKKDSSQSAPTSENAVRSPLWPITSITGVDREGRWRRVTGPLAKLRTACEALVQSRRVSQILPLDRVASLLGGRDVVVDRRGRHCLEHAVPPHECMKQRRRDMQQDQREERESKIEMRVPKERMQAVALRQDRGKMPAAEQHDGIGGRRQ